MIFRSAGERHLDDEPRHCLWTSTAGVAPETGSLRTSLLTTIAVVGAGYSGLSAALHLAEGGADVAVLEGHGIGHGGSGRNAGLVNAGLWLSPENIVQRLGKEDGERLNSALAEAPEEVFSLIERLGIECEARRAGTLHLAHSSESLPGLRERASELNARGAGVRLIDNRRAAALTGTSAYHGAILDPRAGTIQPLSYSYGLASALLDAGGRIFTKSPVIAIRREGTTWRLSTPQAEVNAKIVLLATNAYSDASWPALRGSFISLPFFQFATRPLGERDGLQILPQGHGAWDTRAVTVCFRLDRGRRLIVGSVGNNHGSRLRGARRWVGRFAKMLFPGLGELEWPYSWVGRIGFTPDSLPRFHMLGPDLIALIGFNGRGIGPGTVFGKAIARHILTQGKSELPLPFRPLRAAPLRRTKAMAYDLGGRLVRFAYR
jgi:glycine/D-amino acid oxidase-like deaminating enzyme